MIDIPPTLRFDPRYPFQNQTKACFDNYCDYYKCKRLLKDDTGDTCEIFRKYFETICPKFWIKNWDDQRNRGTFPGWL